MTEKQIIIDGVDVSECEHITCKDRLNPMCDNTGLCCCGRKNCYFKQLALKKKECEYWKHQAELGSDTTDRLAKQLEEKEQECEELKNKLNSLQKM